MDKYSEDKKGISFSEAHPIVSDPVIWILIFLIIAFVGLTVYVFTVTIPASDLEHKQVKNMDCKTLKEHLVKADLQYVTQEGLEAVFIGKCT